MFQSLSVAFAVLIISIIVLVKSADIILSTASKLAKNFGISEFIIGLTIVSLGTSIPELATSIAASLAGDTGVVMGNIAGSNIANIGLILAIPLLFTKIKVRKREFDRMYMALFTALVFVLFSTDKIISGAEAAILLLIFFLYMNGIFKITKGVKAYGKYFVASIRSNKMSLLFGGYEKRRKKRDGGKKKWDLETLKPSIGLLVGISLLAISSKYTVTSAVDISSILEIPQATIAAILIAVGTSLPEFLVSIRGIKKGYKGMVFGNIVGSNIFNILAVGGIAGLIGPIAISNITLRFILPAMLFFSLVLFVLLKRKLELKKADGIILLLLYAVFVIFLLKISFAA